MASTREERRQMRQRGAGTREIKQVDFGFSFGGPAIGPPESAPVPNVAGSAVPSQTQPARTATPQASQTSSQTGSQGGEGSRKTPASTRNRGPPRPSTYDIPSDDGPGVPRSNKRRRINPPQLGSGSPRAAATTALYGDSTVPNGHSRDSKAPATRASAAIATDAPRTTSADTSPQARSSLPSSPSNERNSTRNGPEVNGAAVVDSARSEEQAQVRTQESRPETAEELGTGDKRPVRARSPKPPREDQSIEVTRKTRQKHSPPRQAEAIEPSGNDSPRRSTSPKAQRSTRTGGKPPRGQRGDVGFPEPNHGPAVENTSSHSQTAEDVASEIERQTRAEHAGTKSNTGSKTKRSRGRPSLASKAPDPRDKKRPEAPAEPARTAGESSAAGARRGRKKKAESRPEPESELEDEPEETQDLEPEPEQGTETAVPKSRRGRPAKKSKRTTERQPAPTEGQRETSPAEEQADTETTRQARRKQREPRGETVPVTVHRLTNASALGAMYTDVDGSGDEEEESADELSSRQKTKLPNRGGVNPADVLSQICRETLEKTLTTLKNGIASETNPTRRAEWTRKRKAVEAFGSELDGRLLDLSEMLDCNFVLGVQLKKAKREMMDLRSHLYQVRRERESIALQMDTVRAKHMEEENAKTARATINNSAHSLELALDRSQRAPSSTEPSSADLEFMLRTVADDVSSRASGSHGGLLQQIRAFNAQLESTARRLERR